MWPHQCGHNGVCIDKWQQLAATHPVNRRLSASLAPGRFARTVATVHPTASPQVRLYASACMLTLVFDLLYCRCLQPKSDTCLLYTSDAADDLLCVDLGG